MKIFSFNYKVFLTIIIVFCSFINSFSQLPPIVNDKLNQSAGKKSIKNIYHTECVSYKLEAGDVAVFSVISSDSIVILGELPLLRQRIEEHTLKVDSTKNDRIFYSHSMTNYVSMESKGFVMDVKRTEHPWTEYTTNIEIDTMGRRIRAALENTNKPLQSPGGAFQPTILPILDYACRHIGEKWTFKNYYSTPETGNPAPIWDEHVFYSMLPPVDTLGRNLVKIELNRTAVNNLDVPYGERGTMQIVNAKNTFGHLYFDRNIDVPVLQEVTSENKMKIYGFNDDPTETHHFYDTKIILESFVRNGKTIYKSSAD